MSVKLHRETVERETTAGTDIIDLTEETAAVLERSGIGEGTVCVFTPGSTAAITTIEFESGVIADLAAAIERMAPQGIEYRHDARWGDGNGYSHVRAALLGPSLTVPAAGGKLLLGTWQQIVLCDFDNRPRRRRIIITAMGR